MLTGAQIRMARGYLRWSVKELAEASDVSSATIKRMELVDGVPQVLTASLTKIQVALEARGIELPSGDGGAIRVRVSAVA